MQLYNSIRFVAGGLSDQLNDYLHLLGITSSRQTAIRALTFLSTCAARDLRNAMTPMAGVPVGPSICIDNLDMEQRVHAHSIGHRTMMFHGSWGYIHHPHPSLLESLDLSKLSLKSYYESLQKVSSLIIQPSMFLPTADEDLHFEAVLKSQIARVMRHYIAEPSTRDESIQIHPPSIDPIDCSPPNIKMLKLMDASDNSAEGIGQVIESIISQSGLTAEEFCLRLQVMDGDLGTIQNFNSLRALRTPSAHPEHNLHNISFQLGASHTLWNIAQNILTAHFGDPTKTNDLGAWHYLHALGIPSDKAVPKKDFDQMINNMEKIHEASIFHCLRVIMGTTRDQVAETPGKIETCKWNQIIEACYDRFFSPEARRSTSKEASPKLFALLHRLHDFSTVIEANRAMKAGDIGRLVNIWKIWCIMSQALTADTSSTTF
ncbi:hypothetical protein PGT21_010295 [Puccinia graminis f. sp. tritici]|uniref:DUF6589 domain-containing protein n=1 Tax=Puccinia graminis f. sp. tritici TaxID=56615 RepID=A0A5B0MKB4_PUCGR|nr:hypothetical protein PGT21_010295 [Puccinia graminis f. sp. tritici]